MDARSLAAHVHSPPHSSGSAERGWMTATILNYMQTPPTHYYIESSGPAAYMETHLISGHAGGARLLP